MEYRSDVLTTLCSVDLNRPFVHLQIREHFYFQCRDTSYHHILPADKSKSMCMQCFSQHPMGFKEGGRYSGQHLQDGKRGGRKAHRSTMSPRLTTNMPGRGSTSIQVLPTQICSPRSLSVARIVSAPQSVCGPTPTHALSKQSRPQSDYTQLQKHPSVCSCRSKEERCPDVRRITDPLQWP